MDELKRIWQENPPWQNISWIGNILLFLVIMPYYILTATGDDEK